MVILIVIFVLAAMFGFVVVMAVLGHVVAKVVLTVWLVSFGICIVMWLRRRHDQYGEEPLRSGEEYDEAEVMRVLHPKTGAVDDIVPLRQIDEEN